MDFKNEYLFIRGINKEMESFVEKYLTDTTELSVSSYNVWSGINAKNKSTTR